MKMSTEPAPIEFEKTLAELNGSSEQRLAAIHKLAQLDIRSRRILVTLEQIVLNDPSPEIQQAALEVLSLPHHQRAYRVYSSLNKKARSIMPAEIDRWAQDRLISPRQALLLKGRLGIGTAD